MKNSFLSVIIITTAFSLQSSIYEIEVQAIEGGSPISLSAFAGKKILITTISSLNPDTTQLQFLDSLQNTDALLQVIAVPAADIGEGADSTIANLKTGLSLGFFVTSSAMVAKASGSGQHSLFKWLTNVSENGHFDMDAGVMGQLFIVSSSGILYSVLPGDVPAHILTSVLNQEVTQ